MALYKYVKAQNKQSVLSRMPNIKRQKEKIPRKFLATFSIAFLIVGIFFMAQVIYPLAGWYLFTVPGYTRTVASPLSSGFKSRAQVLASNSVIPEIANKDSRNSYDVKTWFVGANTENITMGQSSLKIYNISIPKIDIDQAIVEVGATDLKKSLIGWPTSPLPGQFGNNIVFGHSELPQFASPHNYAGIFTRLMDLSMGDEILVDFDGVRYKYEVIDKTIVEPTDLSVLEQRFDSAYITLITCVPPGTVWQRGIVRGRLVEA